MIQLNEIRHIEIKEWSFNGKNGIITIFVKIKMHQMCTKIIY